MSEFLNRAVRGFVDREEQPKPTVGNVQTEYVSQQMRNFVDNPTTYQQPKQPSFQMPQQWDTRSMLGRIQDISTYNPLKAQQMFGQFKYLQTDPTSKYYNPYIQPTNRAVGNLAALGIDTSKIDDNFFAQNDYLRQYLKYNGTTNTPTTPGVKASAQEKAAYEYYQIWKSEEATRKAEQQWEELQRELRYWASRTDRNYSDEQILAKIDWSKYDELDSMDQNKKFKPNEYNRAIGYSKDAMYGVIWAARQGQPYDGSIEQAMANSYLGVGKQWQENKDISAMLDVGNEETYKPYALGSTMEKQGLFFGVDHFDQKWIDENAASILSSNDKQAIEYLYDVMEAVDYTSKLKQELSDMQAEIDGYLKDYSNPDDIIEWIKGNKNYKDLFDLDVTMTGLKRGKLKDTSEAVDYKWQDIEKMIRDKCDEKARKAGAAQIVDFVSGVWDDITGAWNGLISAADEFRANYVPPAEPLKPPTYDVYGAPEPTVTPGPGMMPQPGNTPAPTTPGPVNTPAPTTPGPVNTPGPTAQEPKSVSTPKPMLTDTEKKIEEAKVKDMEGLESTVKAVGTEAEKKAILTGKTSYQDACIARLNERVSDFAKDVQGPAKGRIIRDYGSNYSVVHDVDVRRDSMTEKQDRLDEIIPEWEALTEKRTQDEAVAGMESEEFAALSAFVTSLPGANPAWDLIKEELNKGPGEPDPYDDSNDRTLGYSEALKAFYRIVTGTNADAEDPGVVEEKAKAWWGYANRANPIDQLVANANRNGDDVDELELEEGNMTIRLEKNDSGRFEFAGATDNVTGEAYGPDWKDTVNSKLGFTGFSVEDGERLAQLERQKNALTDEIQQDEDYIASQDSAYTDANRSLTFSRLAYDAAVMAAEATGKNDLDPALFTKIESAFNIANTPVEPMYSPFNAYDYAVEVGAITKENAILTAKENESQLQTAIAGIEQTYKDLKKAGVTFTPEQEANVKGNIKQLQEQATDAKYIGYDGLENADELAAKGKSLEKDLDLPTMLTMAMTGKSESEVKAQKTVNGVNGLLGALIGTKDAADTVLSGTEMSKEEWRRFDIILAAEGQPAAQSYLNHLLDPEKGTVTVRRSIDKAKWFEEQAENNPLAGFAVARAAKLISTPSALGYRLGQKARGGRVSQYNRAYDAMNAQIMSDQGARKAIVEAVGGQNTVLGKLFGSGYGIIAGVADLYAGRLLAKTALDDAVSLIGLSRTYNLTIGNKVSQLMKKANAVATEQANKAYAVGTDLGMEWEDLTKAAFDAGKAAAKASEAGKKLSIINAVEQGVINAGYSVPMAFNSAEQKYWSVLSATNNDAKAGSMAATEFVTSLVSHAVIMNQVHKAFAADPDSVVSGVSEFFRSLMSTEAAVGISGITTNTINAAVEKAVLGADSQWQKNYDRYHDELGYTPAQAERLADADMSREIISNTLEEMKTAVLRHVITSGAGAIKNGIGKPATKAEQSTELGATGSPVNEEQASPTGLTPVTPGSVTEPTSEAPITETPVTEAPITAPAVTEEVAQALAKDLQTIMATYDANPTGAATGLASVLNTGDLNTDKAAGQALVASFAAGDPHKSGLVMTQLLQLAPENADIKSDIVKAALTTGRGNVALKDVFEKVDRGEEITQDDVNKLISAVQKDMTDDPVGFQKELQKAVTESVIANKTVQAASQDKRISTAKKAVTTAKNNLANAEQTLAEAEENLDAAKQAAQDALTTLEQEGTKEAVGPVQQTQNHVEGADRQVDEAEKAVAIQEKKVEEAEKELEETQTQVMTEVREQVQSSVQQEQEEQTAAEYTAMTQHFKPTYAFGKAISVPDGHGGVAKITGIFAQYKDKNGEPRNVYTTPEGYVTDEEVGPWDNGDLPILDDAFDKWEKGVKAHQISNPLEPATWLGHSIKATVPSTGEVVDIVGVAGKTENGDTVVMDHNGDLHNFYKLDKSMDDIDFVEDAADTITAPAVIPSTSLYSPVQMPEGYIEYPGDPVQMEVEGLGTVNVTGIINNFDQELTYVTDTGETFPATSVTSPEPAEFDDWWIDLAEQAYPVVNGQPESSFEISPEEADSILGISVATEDDEVQILEAGLFSVTGVAPKESVYATYDGETGKVEGLYLSSVGDVALLSVKMADGTLVQEPPSEFHLTSSLIDPETWLNNAYQYLYKKASKAAAEQHAQSQPPTTDTQTDVDQSQPSTEYEDTMFGDIPGVKVPDEEHLSIYIADGPHHDETYNLSGFYMGASGKLYYSGWTDGHAGIFTEDDVVITDPNTSEWIELAKQYLESKQSQQPTTDTLPTEIAMYTPTYNSVPDGTFFGQDDVLMAPNPVTFTNFLGSEKKIMGLWVDPHMNAVLFADGGAKYDHVPVDFEDVPFLQWMLAKGLPELSNPSQGYTPKVASVEELTKSATDKLQQLGAFVPGAMTTQAPATATSQAPAAPTPDVLTERTMNKVNPVTNAPLADWQDPSLHGAVGKTKKKLNPHSKAFQKWLGLDKITYHDGQGNPISREEGEKYLIDENGAPISTFRGYGDFGNYLYPNHESKGKPDNNGKTYYVNFYVREKKTADKYAGSKTVTKMRVIDNWETAQAAMQDLGFDLIKKIGPDGKPGYQVVRTSQSTGELKPVKGSPHSQKLGSTFFHEDELKLFAKTYGGDPMHKGLFQGFITGRKVLILKDLGGINYSVIPTNNLRAPDGSPYTSGSGYNSGHASARRVAEWAFKNGYYDTVIFDNIRDDPSGGGGIPGVEICTKEGWQFKSIWNSGKYSQSNPHILAMKTLPKNAAAIRKGMSDPTIFKSTGEPLSREFNDARDVIRDGKPMEDMTPDEKKALLKLIKAIPEVRMAMANQDKSDTLSWKATNAISKFDGSKDSIAALQKVKVPDKTIDLLVNGGSYEEVVKSLFTPDGVTEIDRVRDVMAYERGSCVFDKNGKASYTGEVVRGKRLDAVIGLPAGGKSTLCDALSAQHGSLLDDCDEAKKEHKDYKNGSNSGPLHNESRFIMKLAEGIMIGRGDNVVLPIVGHNYGSVTRSLKPFIDAGYEIHLHRVDIPWNEALVRSLNRLAETGRLLDIEYLMGEDDVGLSPMKINSVFDKLIKEGIVDGYAVWDNDVPRGNPPTATGYSDPGEIGLTVGAFAKPAGYLRSDEGRGTDGLSEQPGGDNSAKLAAELGQPVGRTDNGLPQPNAEQGSVGRGTSGRPKYIRPDESRVSSRLLSKKVTKTLAKKGVTDLKLKQADQQRFSSDLDKAKANNSHGAYVDAQSVESLQEKGAIILTNEEGSVGVAIGTKGKEAGNIFAVFKNSQSFYPINHASTGLITAAIAQGGDKLDCFDGNLRNMYARVGMIPVARVAFNEEYMPDGWNVERDDHPDVVFWMHNGDSPEEIARKYDLTEEKGGYHKYTPEEIKALPLYEDYDEAWDARDRMLATRKSVITKPGVVQAMKTAAPKPQTPTQKQAAKVKAKLKSPQDIMDTLSRESGIPTYITNKFGRMSASTRGFYDPNADYEAIRNREAGNQDVRAHETGHGIFDMIDIQGTPQMVSSMLANNDAGIDFSQYSPQQLLAESEAEFMRHYINDGEAAARAFAGNTFYEEFESKLAANPKLYKAVKKAQDSMTQWREASTMERIGATIKYDKNPSKIDLDSLVRTIIARAIDRSAPAEAVGNVIREATGNSKLDFAENLRGQALLGNNAQRRAIVNLSDFFTDTDGTIIGDGLSKRMVANGFKYTEENIRILDDYLKAKISMEREAQGKQVFDSHITTADRQQFIDEIEMSRPDIVGGAEAYWGFWKDFRKVWLTDEGYLPQSVADEMDKMYPHYAPTIRVSAAGDNNFGMNKRGSNQYKIYGAKGGTQDVFSPFYSMVGMVEQITSMVLSNKAARTFDELYQKYEGLGEFGRLIPDEEITEFDVDPTELNGRQQQLLDLLQNEVGTDIMDKVLEITKSKPGMKQASNEPGILKVQRADGTVVRYQMSDKYLYELLAGVQDSDGRHPLLQAAGQFTRMMSMLTTGSNPFFALRNMVRDIQTSVNYGTWASSYVDAVPKWLKAFVEVANGESEAYKQYLALGGGGWTRMDISNSKGIRDIEHDMFGYDKSDVAKRLKWLGVKAVDTITAERLNEIIEQTSRYVEFAYGKHDLSTPEGRKEAFLASREVSVDFSRKGAGPEAYVLSKLVPFFNASTQGVYRTARQFTQAERGSTAKTDDGKVDWSETLENFKNSRASKRFAKTVINTALASALSLGLILMTGDKELMEEYDYLSDDIKSKHLILPNPLRHIDEGASRFLRIPLAQDPLGYAVNAVVTNALWNGTNDGTAIGLAAAADAILDNLNPVSSSIFQPFIDASHHRTYFGGNTIRASQKDWSDPTVQYNEDTPEIFRTLGRVFNASPEDVEYIFQQYSGFIGQTVLPAISIDKSGNLGGLSAIGRTFANQWTADPTRSTNVINDFYGMAGSLDMVKKAAKNDRPENQFRRSLTQEEVDAAYLEAEDMLKSDGLIDSTKKMLAEMYSDCDKINANTTLSDSQKAKLVHDRKMEALRQVQAVNEKLLDYYNRYMKDETLVDRVSRGPVEGKYAHVPTDTERMSETFQNDSESLYMKRVMSVYNGASGSNLGGNKSAALPHPSRKVTINGKNYTIADDDKDWDDYESAYRQAYQDYVERSDRGRQWDKLDDAGKYSVLKAAHSAGSKAIRERYARNHGIKTK